MNDIQNNIELNQTIKIAGEKPKSLKQNTTTGSPFDQILGMLNLAVPLPNLDVPVVEASMINNPSSMSESFNMIEPGGKRDLIEINNRLENPSDLTQPLTSKVSPEDGELMLRFEQSNQTVLFANDTLGFNLSNLVDDFKIQTDQNVLQGLANNTAKNIQTHLESASTEDIKSNPLPLQAKGTKNDQTDSENQHVNSSQTNIGLSLDKNDMLLLSTPIENLDINKEHRRNLSSVSLRLEDSVVDHTMTIPANDQLSNIDSGGSKAESKQQVLSANQFAPELSEWIGRNIRVFHDETGKAEAKFSLFPEHLGHIEVKLTAQNGQITADIITDTPMAKEVLEGQLLHLKQSLQQQGLMVQKLDVIQNQSQSAIDSNPVLTSFSQGDFSSSSEQQAFTSGRRRAKETKETDQIDYDKEPLSDTYGGVSFNTNRVSRIDFTA